MKIVLLFAAAFFLVSAQSMVFHYSKNPHTKIDENIIAKGFITLFPYLAFFFLFKTIGMITLWTWYVNFIISLVLYFGLGTMITNVYAKLFGIKSKPYIDVSGEIVRNNSHIGDSIVTFVIGIILILSA